jgi:hypothetical protein
VLVHKVPRLETTRDDMTDDKTSHAQDVLHQIYVSERSPFHNVSHFVVWIILWSLFMGVADVMLE